MAHDGPSPARLFRHDVCRLDPTPTVRPAPMSAVALRRASRVNRTQARVIRRSVRHANVLLLFLALSLLPAWACRGRGAREVSAALTAEHVLREVHSRYAGKRFTHVTFVQTTTHGDGRTETWYEALAPLGRVRVDIAPLESRSGFIYRADSQYVFRDGSIVAAYADQRWLSMLVLLDLYALPLERVLERAQGLGLRLDHAHEATWRGRPVYVAGALPGDSVTQQVWYDREQLYPVRIIQGDWAKSVTYDWDIGNHVYLDGGWIERRIRIFSAGRLLVTETYDSVVTRRGLPDSLFLPTPYRAPAWRRVPR